MNRVPGFLTASLLVFAFVACAAFHSGASEEVVADASNPFVPPPPATESMGASMRHPFHKMRTTWDKYFEVYPGPLANFDSTALKNVLAEPAAYLDRKIQFDVYFGKIGSFYRPFISPFNELGYVNFSAWAYAAELWNKEERGKVHPLFYIDRRRKELADKVEHIAAFKPVHLWAEVRSSSEGTPWLDVKGAELIPDSAYTEESLKAMELGAKQFSAKHYAQAAEALENALKLSLPAHAEARARSMQGQSYYELRQYAHARNAFVEAVLRDETSVPDLIYLARADLRLNRADEAKQSAEKALLLTPASVEARAELGLALALTGDVKGGYRELEFAQKLAPHGQLAEANRNRAMIAVKEGKLELAKSELNQAVILRASDPLLHLELGDVLLALGQLSDAKREFNFAKDLAPAHFEAYYKTALAAKMLADVLTKDNKTEEAKKLYNEALDNVRVSTQKEEHFPPAFELEAQILKALGKEGEAREAIDAGSKANPKSIAPPPPENAGKSEPPPAKTSVAPVIEEDNANKTAPTELKPK